MVDGPSTFWDRWQANAVEVTSSEGASMGAVNGTILVRRQVRRGESVKFCLGVQPCLGGMEACGTALHWAREFAALGHTLSPPNPGRPGCAMCGSIASQFRTRPALRGCAQPVSS